MSAYPDKHPFAYGRLKKMRKTDEFSSVFRFRCARGGGGLDVLAAANGLDYARLGLIVPKKIIATAVARNRVKRLLREGFRLNQGEAAGLDVVARVKGKMPEADLMRTFLAGLRQCAQCVRARGDSAPRAPRALPTELQ